MSLKHSSPMARVAQRPRSRLVSWPSKISAFKTTDGPSRASSAQQQQQAQLTSQQAEAPQPLRALCTVPDLMAQPSTCLSALAGFALIASNIPLSSISSEHQTGLPAEALPSQSGLQQLLASSSGVAQAATLDAAAQPSGLQAVLSNPVLQLDDAIHQFVATHTTEAFRLMADVWISDAFITAGVLGWVACTAACLSKRPSKAAGPLAAAWGFYFATCGAVGHGDPLLVDALKHLFARARPSTLHHTFSFPSGHTSAAVFIVGSLLTVLLPLTLHLWRAQPASTAISTSSKADCSIGASDGQQMQPSGTSSSSSNGALSSVAVTDALILALWGAAWGTTAAGRILSESHWLSDTLAGGLLAVASVSGLACFSRLLVPQSAEGSSDGTAAGSAARLGDS